MILNRRRLLGGALVAPLAARLPLAGLLPPAPPQALTYVPNWGGLYNISVLTPYRPDAEVFRAVHYAARRSFGGLPYRIVGSQVGRRYDLPEHPWQLYVEVSHA